MTKLYSLEDHRKSVHCSLNGEAVWGILTRAVVALQTDMATAKIFRDFNKSLARFSYGGTLEDALQLRLAINDLIADDFRRNFANVD